MFDDLISLFSYARNEFPWSLLFVLLLILITNLGRRGKGRGDAWRQRMEQMRERAERQEAEQSAFREQTLAELRKLTALTEKQNAMIAKIVGESAGATETVEAPSTDVTETAADMAANAVPANEI